MTGKHYTRIRNAAASIGWPALLATLSRLLLARAAAALRALRRADPSVPPARFAPRESR